MVVIVTGPSGAGKSTVGRALAEAHRWSFADADDLHAPLSVEKMRRGIGLDEEDRWPWLERVKQVIDAHVGSGRHLVVACSALRETYRTFLAAGRPDVRFVYLRGTPELLETRLARRSGHFAAAGLLRSQLETLEPPVDALQLDASRPVSALIEDIAGWLRF